MRPTMKLCDPGAVLRDEGSSRTDTVKLRARPRGILPPRRRGAGERRLATRSPPAEPAALLNRVREPQGLLPPDWLNWAADVAAAPGDDTRLALIESFLLPRWQALAADRPPLGRYRAWAESLALRAATSAAGRSVRQAERRIKAWAGLPMRELRALSRAEEAFLATGAAQGTQRWAEVAAEHGYADQSHLCRETRRITGFSPAELERRVRHDPSFWAYRLWL